MGELTRDSTAAEIVKPSSGLSDDRAAACGRPARQRRLCFSGLFFLACISLLLLHLAIALLVDPRNYYGTGICKGLIREISDNTRREKMALFTDYRKDGNIDGLLLGSSRVMKLDPKSFAADGRYFNFGVSGALPADALAIYRWVRAQGAHPSVVIIGLDVHAFDPNYEKPEELRKVSALYRELGDTDGGGLAEFARMARIIYSTTFVKELLRVAWYATQRHQIPKSYAYHPDGLLVNARDDRLRAAGQWNLDKGIQRYCTSYSMVYQRMPALSPKHKAIFETVIREARADHADVRLWITPLHPTVSAYLSNTHYPRLLGEMQAYLAALHGEYGVTVYDCHDPSLYGGTTTDWYDGVHVTKPEAERIGTVLRGNRDGF